MRLSEKQRNEPPVKLTRAEKREIQAIIRKYKGDGKAHSAQASIPYQAMYPDGICKVTANTFSKCIEFADISYQLAQADTKTAILKTCAISTTIWTPRSTFSFPLSTARPTPSSTPRALRSRRRGDDFDHIRELYTQMLRKQLERGNNGLIKTKYLTLTIEARDSKTARARFSRIVMDALNHFKVMGALAKELGGKEWLEMLHGILHPDGERVSF